MKANTIRKLSFDEIFKRQPTLEELKKLQRVPVSVLVEDIRSMHNVGSIFRTSDGARIEHLYLTGFTAQPPRIEIDKTALGATDSVPWSYHKQSVDVVKQLKQKGINIVVLEHTSNSKNYFEADYSYPLCLVLGNEVEGVSQQLVEQADLAVEIPMLGIKQSLNVSVAYGIVIYHILGNYLKNHKFKLDING
ncbi:MAG TPA: TrmH family RNA methyltransferase [Caldithrix abyssi]|uniref:TrmH family RNA methyltransferase n=1 Tax=Caldithrix abyssi TaxID=187145 RepID=A0A7V5LKF4_CALAY|nr:TrmH family RNA methyltransferase [Caldithrix abyssi]